MRLVIAMTFLAGLLSAQTSPSIGRGGSAVTESAHQMMVSHSLLEAASHAWYVQSPEASTLLREARDTLTSSQTFVAHPLPWKMPALGQVFKPIPFQATSSTTIEWTGSQPTVLVISDAARPVVTISMNGKVTLGKGFTADKASRLFWQKIAEAYPSVCTLKKDSK